MLAEQYTPGKLDGELIVDEVAGVDGKLGVVHDGERWQYVPAGWWAVAIPGERVVVMPPSIYQSMLVRGEL